MTTPGRPFASKDTANGSTLRHASFGPARAVNGNDRRDYADRRTSSIVTDGSNDDRPFSSASHAESNVAESARGGEYKQHDVSVWYSLPLVFAIVPAIGGVAFKGGATIATDLALLCLAGVYLNWCLTSPWVWYHSCQAISRQGLSDASMVEALSRDEDQHEDRHDEAGGNDTSTSAGQPRGTTEHEQASKASKELHVYEVLALACTVLGPILGAWILHLARSSLHGIADDLITNLHLTLFVLFAEIRPVRHCMKMVQSRTLYLQRIVHEDQPTADTLEASAGTEIMARIGELEAAVSNVASRDTSASDAATSTPTPEAVKRVQLVLQPQIDALNRAVRRYEKRATAQAMQTEARLHDLEARLKDALSLAAAAATYSQQPGGVALLVNWLGWMLLTPLQSVYAAVLYPLHVVSRVVRGVLLQLRLVRPSLPVRPAATASGAYATGHGKMRRDGLSVKSAHRNAF